jgi:hypothetical protein
MTTFVNPIKPRGGTGYGEALSRIKAWTRAAIAEGEGKGEPAISVTELACAEPGCPPRETVVLVMWTDGIVWKLRIHKSMTDVTTDDVRHAIQSPEPIKRAGA